MNKKRFNEPGLYWYDGVSIRKLKKPMKYEYEYEPATAFKIPRICITKKKLRKVIENFEEAVNECCKYQYYKGHDDAIDEILDSAE